MSYQDQSHPLFVEIFQALDDILTRVAVQVAGRFVCKNNRWLHDSSARNGNALTLSARQLVRTVFCTVAEAKGGQGRLNA